MTLAVDPISDIHVYGLDVKNREIYLNGYVTNSDEDPGVDYRMASNLIKNIRVLDLVNHDPIFIHMHSVGGEWNDGMAMYDAISLTRSHVTIIAYGQAESMSSILLQSADNRVMMPNAYFMSHFGSSSYSGHYLDVQNTARFEVSCNETMLDIYTESCMSGKYFEESYKSVDEDKVKGFLRRKLKNGDWYLNAHESVYYGLSDCVLSTRKHPSIDSLKYE
jgi:ATP-dependent Clp protease protease subunit